jgi:type 1 fimbriae regulatory protein FimB/type 1 fimbriae regulatory protein FimE
MFTTESGRGPLTDSAMRKSATRAGETAGIEFPVHPHVAPRLRLQLANEGHDTRAIQHYLGHRNIQHTVRYTELAPERFKRFWMD